MGSEARKYLWPALGFAAIFVAVIVVFSLFMNATSSRIVAQNAQYVTDASHQTTKMVANVLENALKDVETIATLSTESARTEDAVADEEWLQSVAGLAPFDTIDFVDSDGMLHSPGREPVSVRDRSYFQRAMAGESGVEAVLGSRVTNENLLYFYAPVYDHPGGKLIGFLLAHYHEARMTELLETDFFGLPSKVLLCLPDGTVVASSDSSQVGRNLLEEGMAAQGENRQAAESLVEAFRDKRHITFEFNGDAGTASASVTEVPEFGWMVVEAFPSAATETMIQEANNAGWWALGALVLVFLVAIIVILAMYYRKRRTLSQDMRDRIDAQEGLAKLTGRLALIDFSSDEVRAIQNDGSLKKSTPAPYGRLVEDLRTVVVGEKAAEDVDRLLSKQAVVEAMPLGTDVIRFEFQVHGKDGDNHWHDFNFICVARDHAGRPQRIVFTTQDVTDLKAREKNIQMALEDSYHAAIMANNAKSDFLSRMSHDIRTPMNAIVGMTELARMNEGDWNAVDDCLGKIELSSNHLLSLINEVLDLSMIESGRMALNLSTLDLRMVMKEMDSVFAQRCAANDLRLSVIWDDLPHPLVECDELRLKQVFNNLMGNAVKFTPAGGSVAVHLTERPGLVEGSSDYEFVFADTGCGMSEEFQERMFEPFAREHDSRIEAIEGSGLGLSITANMVQLMGGAIDVKSTLGSGTTFTIVLTLRYVERPEKTDGEAKADEDEASAENEPTPDFSGKRVLLVEDNELNSEIAMALLESLGIEVTAVFNGQEALDALAQTEPDHFDLVLMDIQMPVMNGLEATSAIRSSDREDLRRIPVVVLSANAFSEDAAKSKRAGADDHLSKPISMKKLTAMLRSILG